MWLLLNPRFLIAAAILALLAFTHTMAWRKGASNVKAEWTLATANANTEARRLENARQRRLDEATVLAQARATRDHAAAVRAAGSLDGLLHAARSGRQRAEESLSACRAHAATVETVLGECGRRLVELGAAADGHASDSLMYQQSWPKQ